MKNQNWRKVLHVHITSEPEVEEPAFIVYSDPQTLVRERTEIMMILDSFNELMHKSESELSIDDAIQELKEMGLIKPIIIH